jgi:phasin family protein
MANKPKPAYAVRAPAPFAEPEVVTPTEIVAAEAVVTAPEVPASPAAVAVEAAVTSVEAAVTSAEDSVMPSVVVPDTVVPALVAVEVVVSPVPVKQNMEKVVKTAEEFVAFGQGNVEAFVKSGQIWAAGVQDLSKQAAATAQAQFDETMSAFKAMTSLKSVKDLFELQGTFARSAMEKTMSESGKLTEASLKLTEQALAPIAARVTIAVETFGKTA